MHYSENFKSIIKKCKDKNLYLGTGNPNSSILVIGKECAIELNSRQHQIEILNNINDWENNTIKNIDFDDVPFFINNPEPIYNPIFPYKGQKLAVRKIIKDKKIINEEGTSDTWVNYQKLNNKIFAQNTITNTIDFHKSFFITEMNEVVSKTSEITKKEAKENVKKSINERIEFFKNDTLFFQNFSIVILACGRNYISDKDIENTFYVKKQNEEILKRGQYFKLFYNQEKTKLVINTRQFSSGVLETLMVKIANEINSFTKENEIKL